MPNRLAGATSPYQQQHADNPVDWYPWGEEALAKARAESKRENTPASTVSANAVTVSIPFMHLSASTRSRQRGLEAHWATLFSMAFFCDSIWRTSEM